MGPHHNLDVACPLGLEEADAQLKLGEIAVRLVTWNVCDDVARKIAHLERLGPDIAVLQEVRPDGLADAGLARKSIWEGASKRRARSAGFISA